MLVNGKVFDDVKLITIFRKPKPKQCDKTNPNNDDDDDDNNQFEIIDLRLKVKN